jgi:hypothetical protein
VWLDHLYIFPELFRFLLFQRASSTLSSSRLAVLFKVMLLVITFIHDKRFGQFDTGQRKMEGDTTIGGVWKTSNTVFATIHWDFVPWPQCSHEQVPKVEFAVTSTNL